MEKAARGRLLRLSVNQAPSLRELSAEPTEGVERFVALLPSPLGDTSLGEGGKKSNLFDNLKKTAFRRFFLPILFTLLFSLFFF